MIWFWLCVAEPGLQLDAVIGMVDIAPTILELAGGTPPPEMDGGSSRGPWSHHHAPLYIFDAQSLRKYKGWCMNAWLYGPWLGGSFAPLLLGKPADRRDFTLIEYESIQNSPGQTNERMGARAATDSTTPPPRDSDPRSSAVLGPPEIFQWCKSL
jgi:hypothetical protein